MPQLTFLISLCLNSLSKEYVVFSEHWKWERNLAVLINNTKEVHKFIYQWQEEIL